MGGRPVETEPYTGFWGRPTSSVQWCETNYEFSVYIAEFWNTLSNLGFIIVGLFIAYIAHKQKFENRFVITYWGVAVIGLGSACFHATLTHFSQQADETPMLWNACAWTYIVYADTLKYKFGIKPKHFGAALIIYAVSFAIIHWYIRFVTAFHLQFGALMLGSIPMLFASYRHISTAAHAEIQPKSASMTCLDHVHIKSTDTVTTIISDPSNQLEQEMQLIRKRAGTSTSDVRSLKASTCASSVSSHDSFDSEDGARLDTYLPCVDEEYDSEKENVAIIEETEGNPLEIQRERLRAAPSSDEERNALQVALRLGRLYIQAGIVALALWLCDLHLCHLFEDDVAAHRALHHGHSHSSAIFPFNPQGHAWWHILMAVYCYAGGMFSMFVRARELGRKVDWDWYWGVLPVVCSYPNTDVTMKLNSKATKSH